MKDLPPFRNMDKERESFNSLKDIYFEDPSIKKVINSKFDEKLVLSIFKWKKPQKEIDLKILKHDVPFIPSNPPKKVD